jgi:bifunctional DNase/RNase
MLIEMRVASLTVDPFTNMPIVVLKCAEGRQSVAIWIGMIEASAIAIELDNIELDRPMTHDLMAAMLTRCGVAVDRIEVHDLRDNTFYASVYLKQPDGVVIALDARPSDAIALALRANAPIRVAKKVVDKARKIDLRLEPPLPNLRAAAIPAQAPLEKALHVERLESESTYAALLESLGETAFGKWKM